MTTEELKKKYYCAVMEHGRFQRAYQDAVESVRKCFEKNDAEHMKEFLDFAKDMLEVSAIAREEMDEFEKQLKRRKVSY